MPGTFTDPLPPRPADDAGADVDQRLLRRCRLAIEVMANYGLDWHLVYAELIEAVDAKEWAIVEEAKGRIQA